uniref:contact-dependent growth inhibition system immunity protein n=1 Tax=Paenibacillus sp. FSL K6-0276 TaxID=2921450 RepID=UPI00403EFBEE
MDFSVEDLRIMIGQGFSLKYLVPIALRYLADNPFVRGDFYKGDLLVCVINIEQTFWDLNPETHVELDSIITDVKYTIEKLLPLVSTYKTSNR